MKVLRLLRVSVRSSAPIGPPLEYTIQGSPGTGTP